MARVLLITPASVFYAASPTLPLGPLAIGSYLTANGYDVKLVDRNVKIENIKTIIDTFNPNVVGISLLSYRSIRDAIRVSKIVQKMGIPVIWGGQIPSVLIEDCINTGVVDYVIIGEGEKTFRELTDAITSDGNIEEIHGIAYFSNGKIIQTTTRELSDLSEFPITDWSLIDPTKYSKRFMNCKRLYYIYAGKGCPSRCQYCSNNQFSHFIHRSRPQEHVIKEIRFLQNNYGLDGVYFSDEYWYPNLRDMRSFCKRVIEEKLVFHWGCQTRADTLSKEDLQLMYEAGCRWIFFGVESGSPEILTKMGKQLNLKKVRETFDNCREIGISATASFIIGYLDETPDQLRKTVQLALDLGAGNCSCCILAALPGCVFYDELLAKGIIKKREGLTNWTKYEFAEVVTDKLSKIPTTDLMVVRSIFRWRGFIGSSPRKKDFTMAKDLIFDELKYCFTQSPFNLVVGIFRGAKEFFSVFWYSHAYPKILKKYGFTEKN